MNNNLDLFWTQKPQLINQAVQFNWQGKQEDKLYEDQANHLASAILIQDYDPGVEVDQYDLHQVNPFIWPDRGELISGSFMVRALCEAVYHHATFEAEDIDIYFHAKEDALEFLRLNMMFGFNMDSEICGYGSYQGMNFNLIWGIEYKSPEHLITRFDIRACSVAFDPSSKKVYVVRGTLDDANVKNIVFNPVPRGVSVRRLVKYVEKGFQIDPHQRLFFAELVRSDLYSTELELITARY